MDGQIKFNNAMLNLSLYGYRDPYLIVKGRVTFVGHEGRRVASEQVVAILAAEKIIK